MTTPLKRMEKVLESSIFCKKKKKHKKVTGLSLAKKMKGEGYDNSEILQKTGYYMEVD